jgi:hypothetical protein
MVSHTNKMDTSTQKGTRAGSVNDNDDLHADPMRVHWDKAVRKAFSTPTTYESVVVLLIYWADDGMNCAAEVCSNLTMPR